MKCLILCGKILVIFKMFCFFPLRSNLHSVERSLSAICIPKVFANYVVFHATHFTGISLAMKVVDK